MTKCCGVQRPPAAMTFHLHEMSKQQGIFFNRDDSLKFCIAITIVIKECGCFYLSEQCFTVSTTMQMSACNDFYSCGEYSISQDYNKLYRMRSGVHYAPIAHVIVPELISLLNRHRQLLFDMSHTFF